MRIRSIELHTPARAAAVAFLTNTWGLLDAGKSGATAYLRGTEDHSHVLSLTDADAPGLGAVTFSGTGEELERIRARASAAGARMGPVAALDEPGGGSGFLLAGPEGRVFRFVTGDARVPARPGEADRPLQVTHVVLNARDREACTRFLVDVFGFRLSDRTGFMNFVRCDSVHHSIALAQSDAPSLNHIAFEMPDLDSVMRGVGRLKDAGFPSVWGPGRHGPGNNVFAYFATPFGAICEYTSEVQRIGEDYRVGGPDDWKWPPRRVDHWGVSARDTAAMSAAEKNFRFLPARV